MYYLLEPRYLLRGWDRLPYAIIDRKYAKAFFITKTAMDALSMCNGQVDFSVPLIPEDIRAEVPKLADRKIIRVCEPGETILPQQEYRLYPNRYMESALWSITGRCNCKCRHCYMSAPDAKYGELTHEQVMKIIKEMGECGILSCSVTGGEPLVRSDFWDIIDGLTDEGIFIPTIYTNGLLVNETFLDGLKKRGLRPEINMSFDGPMHHDWLRGINGAEKSVRRAFEICHEMGFPTGAEMCIWKDNAFSIRETVNTLASLGCSSIKAGLIFPSGAWKINGYVKDHSFPEEEILPLYLNYIDDFYRDLPKIRVNLSGFFYADGNRPDEYTVPVVHSVPSPLNASICMHARSSLYISAEGRALTCMSISSMDEDFQKKYPLIQEEGLRKCLTDSAYMELINMRAREIFAHNEKCRSCKYQSFCMGGCRAAAMRYHKDDFLGVDELICSIFRDGWMTRLFEKVSRLRPEARCRQKEVLEKAGLL